MLTNFKYESIDPKTIIIADRSRENVGDIDGLKESITSHGLINPISIDSNLNLIAGERRLTSALELNLDLVPVKVFLEVTKTDCLIIEASENLQGYVPYLVESG